MNLSFDEELFLALYLELFNREYDVGDEREYQVNENSIIKVRHVEMQNAVYLFQTLRIVSSKDYFFSWDYYGPSSLPLKYLLESLDNRKEMIDNFYIEYNNKRNEWYQKYQNQIEELLKGYVTKSKMGKVAMACYMFEDVVNKGHGSEILAGILYLYESALQDFDSEDIQIEDIKKEMQKRGYEIDNPLTKDIWRDLTILDIVEMKPKKTILREQQPMIRERKKEETD